MIKYPRIVRGYHKVQRKLHPNEQIEGETQVRMRARRKVFVLAFTNLCKVVDEHGSTGA